MKNSMGICFEVSHISTLAIRPVLHPHQRLLFYVY